MQIELTDVDLPDDRAAVARQLDAHNEHVLGKSAEPIALAVLLRDADGGVEGGMWGRLRFGWLYLEFAVIPTHRRGTGLGTTMLAAIERATVARGGRGVRTGSFSFQAPGFYIRRGYTEYARLEGHPPGHHDVSFYKVSGLGDGDAGLEVEQDPNPSHRTTLRSLLAGHNAEQAGPVDFRHLAVLLRGADGSAMGGLLGYTGRGWMHVELFALPPAARGSGLGTRVMEMAHDEARARDALGAKLATASYQARPFYERLGYTIYGTIPDYQPGGHARFLMARRLDR